MAAPRPTIAAAIAEAARAIERVDATTLLCHVLKTGRAFLAAHPEQPLTQGEAALFDLLVASRRMGVPVAYLVGSREFYGRSFLVDKRVLIPRPETEHLVDWLAEQRGRDGALAILDLGVGSGTLAVTLACEWPAARVVGVDISADAIAVASANRDRLLGADAGRVELRLGDWWGAVGADERFSVIVGNPPYVATSAPELAEGDLRFEPSLALASGVAGLDALTVIAGRIRQHLLPGALVALEHGYDQGAAVRALLGAAGLQAVVTHRDLAGHERFTVGVSPG